MQSKYNARVAKKIVADIPNVTNVDISNMGVITIDTIPSNVSNIDLRGTIPKFGPDYMEDERIFYVFVDNSETLERVRKNMSGAKILYSGDFDIEQFENYDKNIIFSLDSIDEVFDRYSKLHTVNGYSEENINDDVISSKKFFVTTKAFTTAPGKSIYTFVATRKDADKQDCVQDVKQKVNDEEQELEPLTIEYLNKIATEANKADIDKCYKFIRKALIESAREGNYYHKIEYECKNHNHAKKLSYPLRIRLGKDFKVSVYCDTSKLVITSV